MSTKRRQAFMRQGMKDFSPDAEFAPMGMDEKPMRGDDLIYYTEGWKKAEFNYLCLQSSIDLIVNSFMLVENLSVAMTDLELNTKIAKLLGFTLVPLEPFREFVIKTDTGWRLIPDYCNDWSELMPLVIEHNITLDKAVLTEEWVANAQGIWPSPTNLNPKRALAECLLKVLEHEAND